MEKRSVEYTRHRCFRKRLRGVCLFLMVSILSNINLLAEDASAITQQQVTVTGQVKDASGEPLPGVSIVIKGTAKGVITNVSGNYTIQVPNNNTILIFSFLGFETQEITVGTERAINITLSELSHQLDDVVVMGYYTQNRRDISASVSKVDMKSLENVSATSISTMLAGKAPGLQTVIRSGVPGGGGSGLVIRGNTSLHSGNDITGLSTPLYIVDGVPMSLEDLAGYDVSNNDFLATLNPDEIKEINILKDAAATAIYGSRGANGVIIIATKRGTTNSKARFSGRAQFGVVAIPPRMDVYIGEAERQGKVALLERTLTNLYGDQAWIDIRNGLEIMGYALPSVLTDKYNPAFNNAYDYQDMFYQSGFSQDYSFSMDGGSENSAYRIGLGFRDEEGVLAGYGFSRATLNTSMINDINKAVRNEFALAFSYSSREGGLNDFMKGMPTSPTQLPSSLFYRTPEELNRMSGALNSSSNASKTNNLRISELLKIKILDGMNTKLSWDNSVSANLTFSSNNYFIPSHARNENINYALIQSSSNNSIIGTSILNYIMQKEEHQFTALAGFEGRTETMDYHYISGEGGPSDYLQVFQGFKKDMDHGFSDKVITNYLSYFTRLAYGFKENRYYIEGVLRRDGSSRFGANNKWATFPSIKAHWAFSKEPWMQSLSSWLDFGKLRISYGMSGTVPNDPLLQYNSLISISNIGANINNINSNKMDVKTYGGSNLVVADFDKVANKDLTWATSQEINYGIDLEMFNNRLYINGDIYSKYLSGLMYTSYLPPYLGYSSLESNLVDMLVSGFELGITGYLFPRTSDFQWEWTANFANNKSMVAKLGNGGRDYISGDYAFVVGRPAFQYYTYEYLGALNSFDDLPVNPMTGQALRYTAADAGLGLGLQGRIFPGMPIFTDANGDFLVDGNVGGSDLKIIDNKSPEPKMMGGLHTTMRYKGLSLRVQSSFAFGHHIFNTTLQEQLSKFDDTAAFFQGALYKFDESQFWSEPGDGSYYPMIFIGYSDGGSARSFRRSSMFIEKGDYWSIDNISLSYSIPKNIVSFAYLQDANVSFSVQDAYMWKKSNVLDPRLVSKLGYYNGGGYPISRSFIFGLQFRF